MALQRKYYLKVDGDYQRLWRLFGRTRAFHIYNVLKETAPKHEIEAFKRAVLRLKSAGLLCVSGCARIRVRGTTRIVNMYNLL